MKLENHEYENALLGAILLDNRVLDEYKVKPALFDSCLSKKIFAQIEKFRALGMAFNMVDVGLQLPDIAADVARLTDCNSAANVKFYYDELVELAKRRGLMKLARDMTALVHEAESTGEVFAHVDKSLVEITDNSTSGYKKISEFIPDTLKDIEYASTHKGEILGIPTGFSDLDSKTNGFQKGDLIIIGARPSRGKTALALNMVSAALRAEHKVGMFSIEMSGKSLVKRMIADWGTVSHSRIRSGFLSTSDIASISDSAQSLYSQNFFIDDTANIKLQAFLSSARKMKRNEGIGIIFADYLGLIDNVKAGMQRWEQVSEVSKALKGLARELDIPVVSLSQLGRESEGTKPTMANLRDSGSIEQDADIIGLLHRVSVPDGDGDVEIDFLLEKARNGTTGDIHMIFKPSYMRFKEVEKRGRLSLGYGRSMIINTITT